jgi:hypothetical protein
MGSDTQWCGPGLRGNRSELGTDAIAIGDVLRQGPNENLQEIDGALRVVPVAFQLGDQLTLALNVPLALSDVPIRLCEMIQEQSPVHGSAYHPSSCSRVVARGTAVSPANKEPVQELRNRETKKVWETGNLWIGREQDKRRRLTAPPSKCLHKGFLSTRQIWRVLDGPILFRPSVNYHVRMALTRARDSSSAL